MAKLTAGTSGQDLQLKLDEALDILFESERDKPHEHTGLTPHEAFIIREFLTPGAEDETTLGL